MAPSQRRPITIKGTTSDLNNISATVAQLDLLTNSCERLRIEAREDVSMPSLQGDLIALSTSLRLLKNSFVNNFNSLSCTPNNIPHDIRYSKTIPDLLYTNPGEEAYTDASKLLADFGPRYGTKMPTVNEDLKQWKVYIYDTATYIYDTATLTIYIWFRIVIQLRLQDYNKMIGSAFTTVNTAAAATHAAHRTAMSVRKGPVTKTKGKLQREHDDLVKMLNKLYRGTTLEILETI